MLKIGTLELTYRRREAQAIAETSVDAGDEGEGGLCDGFAG